MGIDRRPRYAYRGRTFLAERTTRGREDAQRGGPGSPRCAVAHPRYHAQRVRPLSGEPVYRRLQRDDLPACAALTHRRVGRPRDRRRPDRGACRGHRQRAQAGLRPHHRSAWWPARLGLRRVRPLALAKPLLALATLWPLVLLARLVDRVGKGTRTTPRDALIAASSDPATHGRAFGFHRTRDTLGAVIGPLSGVGLLTWTARDFRLVVLVATVPAIIGVSLIGRVREPAWRTAAAPSSAPPRAFAYRTPCTPIAPSSASGCSSRSAIRRTPSSSSARIVWA